MIISSVGVRLDPEKVAVLNNLIPPKTKDELKSFVCMMQSNSDFIPNFSSKIALLCDLLVDKRHFKWTDKYQVVFDNILCEFKESALLCFFNMPKNTYIFTDAHQTGLGAILCQGTCREDARPVAFASRCTNKAEKNNPQLDLEAMGIDYALQRFLNYLVGAPHDIV